MNFTRVFLQTKMDLANKNEVENFKTVLRTLCLVDLAGEKTEKLCPKV